MLLSKYTHDINTSSSRNTFKSAYILLVRERNDYVNQISICYWHQGEIIYLKTSLVKQCKWQNDCVYLYTTISIYPTQILYIRLSWSTLTIFSLLKSMFHAQNVTVLNEWRWQIKTGGGWVRHFNTIFTSVKNL